MRYLFSKMRKCWLPYILHSFLKDSFLAINVQKKYWFRESTETLHNIRRMDAKITHFSEKQYIRPLNSSKWKWKKVFFIASQKSNYWVYIWHGKAVMKSKKVVKLTGDNIDIRNILRAEVDCLRLRLKGLAKHLLLGLRPAQAVQPYKTRRLFESSLDLSI